MTSLVEAVREVLGTPGPFIVDGVIQYDLIAEYLVAAMILLIVTSWIFKILVKIFF